MALSKAELKRLQQQSWGNEPEKKTSVTEIKKITLEPGKPNKYLNIIRKDIVCLINAVGGLWIRIKNRSEWASMQAENRDFMESHFPGHRK